MVPFPACRDEAVAGVAGLKHSQNRGQLVLPAPKRALQRAALGASLVLSVVAPDGAPDNPETDRRRMRHVKQLRRWGKEVDQGEADAR